MGKASSAKKIKRVQQAGVSRSPGQRRNLGYPILIVGIIVLGSVLVFFARDDQSSAAGEAPVLDQDNWYAAFGIDICGDFQQNPSNQGINEFGIDANDDGLIHIQPFSPDAAGENATFSVYADQIGLELGDGEFTLADGTTKSNGDECADEDGTSEPGRVALYVWPPQATDATEPEIVTEDLGAVRFTEDGQSFVLAFTPEDAEPTLPPSLPALQNPSRNDAPIEGGDTPEGDAPAGDGATTSVPEPEGTTTVAPEETTTTEPGDG